MKKITGFLVFIICVTISVLSALVLLLGWLLGRAGAFFRRVSWRMDVIANAADEWGEGDKSSPARPGK
jgi:hypothetical protein